MNRVAAAIVAPQSVPKVLLNDESQTGSVRWSWFLMISRFAKANSFQAVMKPNSEVDSSPGASSGKTIRRNAWNWLQPST